MDKRVRNPFGHLLVCPSKLNHLERCQELARCAGLLLAQTGPNQKTYTWLGDNILKALNNDQSLDETLGIRPPRGSRQTYANWKQQTQRNNLILRFANECGSDGKAEAVFHGKQPCPENLVGLYSQLKAFGRLPNSPGSVSRLRNLKSDTR
ncbi:hypothetical protein W822_15620 [Advenella kashmirensis W13003]|uniref:Uncharacterized protein n=1 Tax=Advenella kashmirensis W13003 TaxID=1424334 RepID=V8QR21_9BURK|nr:hypothetical protein [Advenella kashmirensis]ETF02426.1 hypothetical protein W822_15620 [Advenella kashmirensis W13003]